MLTGYDIPNLEGLHCADIGTRRMSAGTFRHKVLSVLVQKNLSYILGFVGRSSAL